MSAVEPLSDEPILLRDDRDGIATLTLNRPKARNACRRVYGGADRGVGADQNRPIRHGRGHRRQRSCLLRRTRPARSALQRRSSSATCSHNARP